ncbi:molybdate ABC transporter substrate-binding protein [Paenarthrobacter sp. DKR-5]|uniref:molybdate ABC transporter substrate-binding protein n=1 Tax=Paenarthrobacter sp. DKR-5 TaxID=2835535 RepID=UPI001BDD57E4|nr:molybdate ABC transporter substrate-binding protein [Paenarthrobacter sp. DKR-5]MBT1001808.1 molybdate ABC transporter substrate-binding protein [Paenarthrobacter sp. DKR-5]
MTGRRARAAAAAVAAGLLAGLLSACSPAAGQAGEPSRTVTVFAAASLKKTFTELAHRFETAHPGTSVKLSFAGSSELAAQLNEGAPADVFASADQANMAKVEASAGVEGKPVVFASNVLTIAVPPANPAHVTSLADLARPGTKVVVCASQVPCGAAARTVERAAGVALHPVSEELSVTDVLGKVSSGEADAGLVYVTDTKAAGGTVRSVSFDASSAARNLYPIAALRSSADKALAAEFVALVAGAEGRKVLGDAGFGAP